MPVTTRSQTALLERPQWTRAKARLMQTVTTVSEKEAVRALLQLKAAVAENWETESVGSTRPRRACARY